MDTTGNVVITHQRRRRGVAVGLGVAAGALLAAALGQLASPPSARADDFSDIVANVEASLGFASSDFSDGQTDFGLGTAAGAAEGLAYDVAGLDNILISPVDDVLLGGLQAALGLTPDAEANFPPVYAYVPTSLADLETYVEIYLSDASSSFSEAQSLFGLDTAAGFSAGVSDIVSALEIDGVLVPEEALVGLADLAGL
jgi:hypothetical protein